MKDKRQVFIVPGTKYTGPGNPIDSGSQTNLHDDNAREHDLKYSTTKKDVKKADEEYLSKSADHLAESLSGKGSLQEAVQSVIGIGGIGIKNVENLIGVQYPKGNKYAT